MGLLLETALIPATQRFLPCTACSWAIIMQPRNLMSEGCPSKHLPLRFRSLLHAWMGTVRSLDVVAPIRIHSSWWNGYRGVCKPNIIYKGVFYIATQNKNEREKQPSVAPSLKFQKEMRKMATKLGRHALRGPCKLNWTIHWVLYVAATWLDWVLVGAKGWRCGCR